jgi:hypothetical protein
MSPNAPQERSRPIALLVVLLLSVTVLASRPLATSAQASTQTSYPDIESYRVSGAVNFSSPGSESFWNVIPWTNVSLAATVSPGGGHTPFVLVKSANDGFSVYMLFRWTDRQGPSYLADNEIYTAANGSLLPLTPGATTQATQLYYNSTYYYPDRVAMLWYVGSSSTQQPSPQMQLGSDGAITGGAAEIWHWQSNPTDSDKNDSGFPGGYTDPAGNPIYPPDNLSFAEDDYTNTTGFYVVAGSFSAGAPNLVPSASPYSVLAGNQYSDANKAWTVEMERTFTTAAGRYNVQLQANMSYAVAFAVWQGKLGESSNFKSVSQWYMVTIGDKPSSSTGGTSAGSSGVDVEVAAAVAIGTLLVGAAAGSVVRHGKRTP